jgi:hypothetical protein
MTIMPLYEAFEGIGHLSEFLTGIDAIEVALAYNCTLKPKTMIEYINDNFWTVQQVQFDHTNKIKDLEENSATLNNAGDKLTVWIRSLYLMFS